jgi:hypothetical protein
MTIVEPTESWKEHAQLYTYIYRNGLSKDFLDEYRVYAGGLCDLLRDPLAPMEGVPPPSEVDISSIGKLEKHVRESYGGSELGLEVLDLGIGMEILSRQAVVYVWTFRRQLTLSVVYNEAFHTGEQTKALLEGVKRNVSENLGV